MRSAGYRMAAMLVVLVAVLAIPAGAGAQDGPKLAAASGVAERAIAGLERPARLVVHAVPLAAALTKLYLTSQVPISFSPSLLPADRNVSCECDHATVAEALERLLVDTGLDYREIEGHVLVYRPASRPEPLRMSHAEPRYALAVQSPPDFAALWASVPVVVVDSARVRGRVLDAGSGEPIPMVTVKLDGGAQALPTNEAGIFAFARVPAGRRVISFERIGYRTQTLTLNLREGQDTTFVVQLSVAPYMLSELVTTGSGERRRMEIGNAAVRVNVDSIMAVAPVHSVTELISQRIPGLVAQTTSGAVGAPTRLRIRGTASIESSNEPIIIVDGIRMSNDVTTEGDYYSGVYSGATQAGANDLSMRLDDIDPNTIESIEVLKGPAASTLYGSEAGNGVIVIKTKRGSEGKPLWSMHADYALTKQPTDYDYPRNQVGFPLTGAGSQSPTCTAYMIVTGQCYPIEGNVQGFNMLESELHNPTATGHTRDIGVSVSGGTGAIGYYLAGSWLDQLGTAKFPKVNQLWYSRARGGATLPEEVIRPNARTNGSVTARFDVRLGSTADVSLGAKFISQYQRTGQDGLRQVMDRPRYPTDTLPFLNGWDDWFGRRTQNVRHVLGNLATNWRPRLNGRDIFTLNLTYGWDLSTTGTEYYAPKNSCQPLCRGSSDEGVEGYISKGTRTSLTQTLNLGMAVNLPVTSWMSTTTRFGGNYTNRNWAELFGHVDKLAIGRKFRGASGTAYINETGDERAMAGWYLEEQFNLREDRLFLTFGLRQDAGSAIGETVRPIYPKAHLSWVLSDEPFFPMKNVVSLFRARAAVGDAGVMPTTMAMNRSYTMGGNFVLDDWSVTGSYAELQGPGNPALDPERSREYEGGFDVELLDGRVAMDFTYFRKYTWGAIHRSPVSGSIGPDVAQAVQGNFGDILNTGFELSATARVIDRDEFSYSLVGNLSSRENELTRLAPGVVTFADIGSYGDVSGTVREGYPLFGNWALPLLGWADYDNNNYIDPEEVILGDSAVFVGPTMPKYTAYMGHYVGLLNNRLTVNANFAYSSGQSIYNYARLNRQNYESTHMEEPSPANLAQQACISSSRTASDRPRTDWCWYETVKVLRLQDVTVSYTLPQTLVQRIGATAASVRVTGRNLFMTSNFKGRDPGVNTAPVTGNAVEGGAAFGAPREYGLGVQLSF